MADPILKFPPEQKGNPAAKPRTKIAAEPRRRLMAGMRRYRRFLLLVVVPLVALMAGAQISLRFHLGREGDDGLAAAEQALSLDPNLAEAHSAKARVLMQNSRFDEAIHEIEIALSLDSESYDANSAAGRWNYLRRRFDEAIRYYEKAATLTETEYMAAGLLVSCYKAVGDAEWVFGIVWGLLEERVGGGSNARDNRTGWYGNGHAGRDGPWSAYGYGGGRQQVPVKGKGRTRWS